jgi:hypothetical protein
MVLQKDRQVTREGKLPVLLFLGRPTLPGLKPGAIEDNVRVECPSG